MRNPNWGIEAIEYADQRRELGRLTIREERDIREIARSLSGRGDAEPEEVSWIDLYPAIATVVVRRSDPSFTPQQACELTAADFRLADGSEPLPPMVRQVVWGEDTFDVGRPTLAEYRRMRTAARELAEDPELELDYCSLRDLLPALAHVVISRHRADVELDAMCELARDCFIHATDQEAEQQGPPPAAPSRGGSNSATSGGSTRKSSGRRKSSGSTS